MPDTTTAMHGLLTAVMFAFFIALPILTDPGAPAPAHRVGAVAE